jgi:hypothetical protein
LAGSSGSLPIGLTSHPEIIGHARHSNQGTIGRLPEPQRWLPSAPFSSDSFAAYSNSFAA